MSKDTEGKSEKIMDMESKVLWYPDSKRNTQMDKFRIQVNGDYGLNLANYNDLYQWSVDSYSEFWGEVWRFCGVVSSKPYEEVVDVSKRISDVPEWFKGARLNYAENLLKHADQEKVALYAATEANEEIVKVTYGELRSHVALFAAAMRKMGIQTGDRVAGETHNLQSLHTILSTGSPLKPMSYDYVYRCIKSNVLLGSISGGTDIVSCFMGQNPTVPVYRGEIQTRNLGMAVEAWSPDGKPVWGESGELVCLKPIPCQPTHFWNDENGSKYHKAYFSSFPGVWAHGDYCKINPKTGGLVMLGRSDGTLNPNGVRFGSSEIYNIVEAFEEVSDSLCVPQYNSDGEERVILFLKMAPGKPFCPDLVAKIRGAIRKALSARHVPALLLETRDIPYTISGKKVEVAVKQVIAGREVMQRGAFSNPDSLDLYKNIPELQNY
ncbi:Acetoacetyl-CoA synthetase [Larimichthys crocea]|uniref:Uncharacterized protein n=1 Tax=Larimichthys crocea TaxID=215358 RepID=A0ACD3Q866_LARCR|nr:Acetoacetyl-CoA synthetase [Larimichthys crocea]